MGSRLVGNGILNLGWFKAVVVKVEVEHLELVMKDAPSLVWVCLSGRMYFLWRLSLMSVDVSSVW